MALVSILIPTYNQADYIGQAVESALQQDWPNLEVIISDDASRDNIQPALEPFRGDERLRVHRSEVNLGRVGNYRKCLYELARGTWVLMLDGDDYLSDPSYISRAMNLASSDPAIDLVFANAYRLQEGLGGVFETLSVNLGLPETIDGRDLFLRMASQNISLFHLTCLYKTEKARALDFYRSTIVSSDWESLFRFILSGKVAFIPDFVAVWRIHGANATRMMSVQDRIQNLGRIVGPYEEAKKREVFPQHVIELWFDRMIFQAADVHLRDLIRSGEEKGRRKFLEELKMINPRVYMRTRRNPKLFWNRLKYFFKSRNN
jgi:glycosyltransferase involved in cell wall biosynthesis